MTTSYCVNHPNRETGLRCKQCGDPICASCAVPTPTGYSCPACIKQHKKKFDTAQVQDYIFAFLVAAFLSFLGSLVVRVIGFFVILIGPAAGGIIAEAVRKVVNKRRSRALFITATVGVVIGGLLTSLPVMMAFFLTFDIRLLLGLLWPGVYVALAAPTTYTRLAGIKLR
jgi:MFS family permease